MQASLSAPVYPRAGHLGARQLMKVRPVVCPASTLEPWPSSGNTLPCSGLCDLSGAGSSPGPQGWFRDSEWSEESAPGLWKKETFLSAKPKRGHMQALTFRGLCVDRAGQGRKPA